MPRLNLKWMIPVLLLLTGALPASAQRDSLRLSNGQRWAAGKLSLGNQALKAALYGSPVEENSEDAISDSVSEVNLVPQSVTIPLTEISAIRFADGFVLPFRAGAPVRDVLVAAPTMANTFSYITAEGMFPLTQEEIRAMYGDFVYENGYRKYRRFCWIGMGKIAVGAAGTFLCHYYDPSEWVTKRYFPDIDKYLPTLNGKDYSVGNLHPGWLTATSFFAGMALGGAIDCFMTEPLQRHLLDRRTNWTPPTQSQVKARYITGGVLLGAGLGTMAGCFAYMNHYKTWYYGNKGENWGESWQKPVPKTTWILMTGGAVLAHLGVSFFQLGSIENSLRKNAPDQPLGFQCSFGPAANGYGLTVRF